MTKGKLKQGYDLYYFSSTENFTEELVKEGTKIEL
jgi:hypothetical protein